MVRYTYEIVEGLVSLPWPRSVAHRVICGCFPREADRSAAPTGSTIPIDRARGTSGGNIYRINNALPQRTA